MEKLICIVCPRGCHLEVESTEQGEYKVKGNACPRGASYGVSEVTAPVRMITSTVRVKGGKTVRCPVKTNAPIAKQKMAAVLAAINALQVEAPIQMHQILIQGVADSEINILATKAVASENGQQI